MSGQEPHGAGAPRYPHCNASGLLRAAHDLIYFAEARSQIATTKDRRGLRSRVPCTNLAPCIGPLIPSATISSARTDC